MTTVDKNATRVLVLHDDPQKYYEGLKSRFPNIPMDLCTRDEQVAGAVERLKPTVIFSWTSVDISHSTQRKAVLDPDVQWVQVGGAGFDHLLPLDDATAVFTNASGVLSNYMAETVTGAMLMLNYGFPKAMENQHKKLWKPFYFEPIEGKTAVIVGMGHIGKAVARHAKQFGMKVIGVRQSKQPVEHVDQLITPDQLNTVLPQADFLCLHVPHIPSTHHLINRESFDLMPDSGFLINTARGGVVDENALLDALNNKKIAGAYVDVFATEPLPKENPLWEAPNLVITPHCSDWITTWEEAFNGRFEENLTRWLNNDPLISVVDVKRGY